MKILGLSGKKHSGKSTVAELIQSYKHCVVVINFADAVKEEVAKACGVTVEHIENNKEQFRPILQWWGTDFRRKTDPEYWLKQWLYRVTKVPPSTSLIIAADVRFENEVKTIESLSGRIFRVMRNENITDLHSSETDLDRYSFTRVIRNDSTIKDLGEAVKQLMKEEEL